jgi:hypothetical protein
MERIRAPLWAAFAGLLLGISILVNLWGVIWGNVLGW